MFVGYIFYLLLFFLVSGEYCLVLHYTILVHFYPSEGALSEQEVKQVVQMSQETKSEAALKHLLLAI